ncbi:putative G-protein gamma [Helianthus debilis subsp. tardiflorus]
MEAASAACKEILSNVETRPDPLLPNTYGPANPSWDQWFEGPQDKSGCRCWIL